MVQYRAILTMVDQYKVVYDLSNGAIFNLLLLVCVSFTIIGQPRNSVLIRRV